MRNMLLMFTVASMSGVLTAAPSNAPVHHVRRGETAASIARSHGLSLAKLGAANPKVRLAKLSIGMILHLPPAHRSEPRLAITGRHATASPLSPVPALPTTPVVRETTLVHLERMLPATPGPELSGTEVAGVASDNIQLDSPENLATKLQPVLVPGLETVASLPKAPEFVAADRDHLDLLWPVETRSISSAWGPRMRSKVIRVKNHRKKRVRYHSRHKGVDLTAPLGTSVFAAMDGQVIAVGRQKQYGNFVTIDHGNGVVTQYAHHRMNLVEVGEVVRRGQKIAEVGRTGNATGPHLHFELRVDDSQRNPLPFLDDEEEISSEVLALNALIGTSRR